MRLGPKRYTHLNYSFYSCSSSSRSIIGIRHLLRDASLIILGMDDIQLGKKLGEGAFCAVYKVSPTNKVAAKDGALVLKRATEYGAVEIWVNEHVW